MRAELPTVARVVVLRVVVDSAGARVSIAGQALAAAECDCSVAASCVVEFDPLIQQSILCKSFSKHFEI